MNNQSCSLLRELSHAAVRTDNEVLPDGVQFILISLDQLFTISVL
jgi:hypothetical protein